MKKSKEKLSQTDKIILGAAIRCGYSNFSEIIKLCGFGRSSFYRYRQDPGQFPMSWISEMDQKFQFTDDEIIKLVRG